jgi:hypothetical protein
MNINNLGDVSILADDEYYGGYEFCSDGDGNTVTRHYFT